MKILTNKHLFERELGNYLFSVPALLEWAKAKGHFLFTEPQIDGYDLAQVESVLCAIERAAEPNLDDAMDMVAATPRLAGHRAADNAHLSRWLVGAEAHRLWREEFTRAIDDGELQLFDAISRMPVRWPPASSGMTEKAAPEVTPVAPKKKDLVAWQDVVLENWPKIAEHKKKPPAREVMKWLRNDGPRDTFPAESRPARDSLCWIDGDGGSHTLTITRLSTVLAEWRKAGKIPA